MRCALYYLEHAEELGSWFGTGASLLGLKGELHAKQFQRVLRGFSPDGKHPLVQNAGGENRQAGIDLTFCAPKSVSVLWSLAPRNVRLIILAAHIAAVTSTLEYLEKVAGITRRGKAGTIKERAGLIFGLFLHTTSRLNDPHVHTHAFLVNVATRPDGTTGALWTKEIFRHKIRAGHLYRERLAQELGLRLGLKVEPENVGFHVQGVPRELCRNQSKRRQSIERELLDAGKAGAKAAKEAAVNTRPKKVNVRAEVLFETWSREAELVGWGRKQAETLLENAYRNKDSIPVQKDENPKSPEPVAAITRTPTVIKDHAEIKPHTPAPVFNALKGSKKNPWKKKIGGPVKQPPIQKSSPEGRATNPFIRWHYLFPEAPKWSPAHKWTLPSLHLGPRARRDSRPNWRNIHWKAKSTLAEFRIQTWAPFPKAWKCTHADKLSVPLPRVILFPRNWLRRNPIKTADEGKFNAASKSHSHQK